MYRYLLIHPDGTLTVRRPFDWRDIEPSVRTDLGEPYERVPTLDRSITGWINSDAHLFPVRHPRNPIGSVVLAALDATPYPYAGTIAFTCWDRTLEAAVDLNDRSYNLIMRIYHDALFAVSYRSPMPPAWQAWGERMRGYARHVETTHHLDIWPGRAYAAAERRP